MRMMIVDRGTVVGSEPRTERSSCAFAQICVLPSGRWLCGFRAAPTKGATVGQHVRLTWSDDEGATWTEPAMPFAPPLIDGAPGVFRALACTPVGGDDVIALLYWVDHSDPERAFFNAETEGLLDSRLFIARSADGGERWGELELLDTTPYNMPTPCTGPILALRDGRLALQFELNKTYEDPAPWRHSSVLVFSSDGGRTWPDHVRVSDDPELRVFYWDQRPGQLADGTLMDLFWTYDRVAEEYLNIHGRESLDGGRTWGELWDTGVPGQPAPPVSLPDGRLLMVYVDRTGAPVIKARASADGGRTWPEGTELVLCEPRTGRQSVEQVSMTEAWEEMAAFSLGLPTTAALANGDVLVTYYVGPETDCTDVEWVRMRG
jgi:hypothetical protein